ncbi:hypothetical protein OG985_06555 [Streptomyces sp. NBC_00289]|uniref:hypothetical protein n=1 Tax=Streptomyces sp. NBC_00289 TaxID=2975703 RepID=UPI0032477613
MTEPGAAAHIPPDELAAHALDGSRTPWSPEEAGHLRLCGPCRDRLAALERAAETGRHTYPHETLAGPPAHVWDAIRTQMRAERARWQGAAASRPAVRPCRRQRAARGPRGTGSPDDEGKPRGTWLVLVRILERLGSVAVRFARRHGGPEA